MVNSKWENCTWEPFLIEVLNHFYLGPRWLFSFKLWGKFNIFTKPNSTELLLGKQCGRNDGGN